MFGTFDVLNSFIIDIGSTLFFVLTEGLYNMTILFKVISGLFISTVKAGPHRVKYFIINLCLFLFLLICLYSVIEAIFHDYCLSV